MEERLPLPFSVLPPVRDAREDASGAFAEPGWGGGEAMLRRMLAVSSSLSESSSPLLGESGRRSSAAP
jgi:hypothetical protein